MQNIHIYSIHGTFMKSSYTIAVKLFTAIFMLFLFPCCLVAQQKTKIILQSSEKSRIVTKTDITYLRNPVFRQDNAILTCDSAVFYTAKNYFEAYKNVHINQADTINIYSDFLTYDGNAKLAHLTSNVRLVDKSSVLTTNVLDYSMGPKVGTYVDGGKIVNKEATITSKNGYYFANSRDAYFRYNVLVVTEQSTIKSDTLRYNTFSNWTYFYGPTNIKEKDGNLYTENGAYNTKTTYAYFGKKNLYTSGSKSLKGDSLYYDGIAGYGKAVRNIVFRDTLDKMLMRGQLGYYYKADQRTVVTKNAYAGLGTNDSVLVKEVKQPDSLWLGADTLETKMVLLKTLKILKAPVIKADNELGEEERETSLDGKSNPAKSAAPGKKTSTAPQGGNKPGSGKPVGDKPGGDKPGGNKPGGLKPPATGTKDSLKTDSASRLKNALKPADSLLKKAAPLVNKTDSVLKIAVTKKDSLQKDTVKLPPGLHRAVVSPAATVKGKVQPGVKKTVTDSLPVNPMDTVLTRSIKAYRHVKVYKSNMQAKADSLFYTSADSTLRWYRDPIIWAQGSQLTGDTIYLQLRNKKIKSVQVIHNAFAVNVEPDSAKFNQVKGKIITGFFKDGKLNTMYVDGNAESVYFTKTDDGKNYDKMNQTISSRIKVVFRNSEIADVVTIKSVEGQTIPVADLKKEVILTGFIWKPELRPLSKRDITNPKVIAIPKKATAKATVKDVKKGLKQAAGTKGINSKDLPSKAAIKDLANGIDTKSIPSKTTIKQVTTAVDSMKLQEKIPVAVKDTAIKALPGLIKKGDSLLKKPVILKK